MLQTDVVAEHTQLERVELIRVRADSVAVVFDEEHDRELPFGRERHRFVELTLTTGSVAGSRDDNVVLPLKLHGPGRAAAGQQVPGGGSRNAPDVLAAI